MISDVAPGSASATSSPDVASARAALGTAKRARAAAAKPVPVPGWYIASIVGLLSGFIASTDAARALSAPWLIGVFGVIYSLGIGICIGMLYQRMGVVSFQGPYLAPTLAAVACCIGAGAGTYIACALAGLPVRGVPAGVVGGTTLAVGMLWVNRRVARDAQQWQG
jgi:hypothetical protein